MEPKIYLLDAITPDTKNWTAKVSVLNKTEPHTSSQPASIRFQKILFGDKKENRIEAMLYRGDIDLLQNSLQPHRTYLISNALVRPIKPGFENPLTNNRFQWILGARTAILATDEDSLISSELSPTFTQCDHFRNYLGSRTLIMDELCFMHKREIDEIQQQGNVFKLAQSNFSVEPKTFTSVETSLTSDQITNLSSAFKGNCFPQNKASSTPAVPNVIV
ncbi:hypothetical protein OROMI_006841 [Orobanche minor]